MGRAKAAWMEHQANVSAAASYLVRKDQLDRCEIHGEIYSDRAEIDPDFFRIAMADRRRGDNGPIPWAAVMEPREFTDLLVEAFRDNCGDECGYCAKNAAE